VDYEKAKKADPANSLYVLHEQNARLNASMLHLKNGRQMLKEGRMDEAAGEFQKAARIDPSNQAAAQELDAVLAKQAQAKKAHTEAIQKALKATEEETPPAPVKLQPISKEPIVHLRIPSADSKKVYETLAKLAGLNIAFTSDFVAKSLSEDLSGVKIEDALNIVALQSKTFWKAVTPNTILVIPDSTPNHTLYDEQVVKTIYLANPLATADRTAITSDLKTVLQLKYIMDNPEANAIVIRDTPAKVAEAEQLVRKLDRAKAEIMIDIDIVEADRDRIRNLGLTPATISGTSITPGIQAGAGFSPPVPTTTSTSTSVSASVQINRFGLSDYAIALPGATAQAVLSDNKTHILQSPQIRVTDGQTAKVKIGSRIPYATGSFLPSLGGTTSSSTGGVGLLASTQFQFQDIGVNLDLTPHLLPTGEIAVHAKIEISSLGASITVGGITEPTFGQRVIEDDFRLQEGEVNLLGGLIQRTLTNEVEGVPGLGDIPLIRYLFSQENKEVNDQEVLIMLTPRVIRLPEPATAEGSAVTVATPGGAEGPGGFEGPRPFEIPTPPQPQPPQ
jgi:general secretion pathway protein D